MGMEDFGFPKFKAYREGEEISMSPRFHCGRWLEIRIVACHGEWGVMIWIDTQFPFAKEIVEVLVKEYGFKGEIVDVGFGKECVVLDKTVEVGDGIEGYLADLWVKVAERIKQ
jgi:hypothetical protein